MTSSPTRQAAAVATGVVAALLIAATAAADPVATKEEQAKRVLAEVQQIDVRVARAAEAYNLASIQLDRIRGEQRRNERLLGVARVNLTRAQTVLQRRLVTLYTSGEADGSLEVLLGATSLADLLDRVDAAERVSAQDAEVLDQVLSFRTQVERRKAELRSAGAKQARVVAARAAQRSAVEAQLRERQRLLSTIRSEIARLRAEERVRQARLRRQLQARLAAQRQVSTEAEQPAAAVASEAVSAAAAPAARYGGVVGIAMRYLGIPYRWGGSSPTSGFDCSGFVMYVYAQVGVSLPHNAAAQYGHGTSVSKSDLQPGDLVFFNGLGHNGIYIGGGQFIHAPHTGDVVKISSLGDSWYTATWYGAKRL